MPDAPFKHCASCGKAKGFRDLPAGYAQERWPDAVWEDDPERLLTQCKACGATFPVASIDESVREAPDGV
jgi:hypothetical protein